MKRRALTSKLPRLMQTRVAQTAVGPSTVRGQGPAGTARAARRFLASVNLTKLGRSDARSFANHLDSLTESLRRALPPGARHWGTARKLVNIFLRDAAYNHALRRHYRLGRLEKWMEVPLDSHVARGITESSPNDGTLRWHTIKSLSAESSAQFQIAATHLAHSFGIARVHLDLVYWRPQTTDT